MSSNHQLSYNGDDENDGESDILYTTRLREGQPNIDFTLSSEMNQKLLQKETWMINNSRKKPSVQPASSHVSVSNVIDMIDTFDRPAGANAEGTYARSGTYAASPKDEPGKRIPKAGAFAEAGVGRASAEYSVFGAEAKGPNASAGAEASVSRLGAGAMARAELGSASAQAGPVGVKLGLGVDTGASIGVNGVEVKFLGTGFSVGPRTSISLLGSEVSCSVM